MAASLSAVGEVMKRVSTSMRADSPGCAATSRSVNTPAIWGFFSAARVPVGAGDADEVGAGPADVGPDVQRAAGSRGHRGPGCDRGHRVTERDDHDIGVGADEQAVAAGVDAAGRNGGKHQAAGGRQGGDRPARDRDVERLRRPGHQRGGDRRLTIPSGPGACGQAMVAVVCLTGSSGASAHSSTPAMPATTAIEPGDGVNRWSAQSRRVARGSMVGDPSNDAAAPGSTARSVLPNRDQVVPARRPGSTA